jgi:outer membrane lipoprotein SlyB
MRKYAMKKKLLMNAVAVMVSLGLSACAPNISPDVVSASNANEVQTAVEGIIVSKRVVTVKGDSNMVGTLAGAVIGAVAGSAVGGGNMRYITGTAGAVGGGAAGNAIEDKLTTQQGIEYVIKLAQQDGSSTTITTTGHNSGSNTDGTKTTETSKGQNSSSTTISSKSAANRYVNVIQGQGSQVLQVGQKVLVAGVNSGHAHIISTL